MLANNPTEVLQKNSVVAQQLFRTLEMGMTHYTRCWAGCLLCNFQAFSASARCASALNQPLSTRRTQVVVASQRVRLLSTAQHAACVSSSLAVQPQQRLRAHPIRTGGGEPMPAAGRRTLLTMMWLPVARTT